MLTQALMDSADPADLDHDPDTLELVTALVEDGDLDGAKRVTARILDTANEYTLDTLARCAYIAAHRPDTALTELRQLAQTAATEQDAALIRACTPDPIEYATRPEAQPPQPEHAPRWNATTRKQTARNERRRINPHVRRSEPERRRIGQAQEPLTVLAYFANRVEGYDYRTDEWTQHTPEGYSLDYDRAAVPPLRGAPCVFCGIERAPAEVHRAAQKRTGHGDDGLCCDCREAAAAVDLPRGIPALPATHTHRDQVQARCAYIAEWHPAAALAILAHEWQRARRCHGPARHDAHTCTRCLIADWVHTHRAGLHCRATETRAALAQNPPPQRHTGARRHAGTPRGPHAETPTSTDTVADPTVAPAAGALRPLRPQRDTRQPTVTACRRCHVPRDDSDRPERGRDDRQCSACRAQAADPAQPQENTDEWPAAA